jgi:hypothetical protein
MLALDCQDAVIVSPLELASFHGLNNDHVEVADLGPWADVCVLHEELKES